MIYRVLMLVDDQRIDRRVLQEAETLIGHGYEVLVLGRAGEGYPASEIDGKVKVERLEYATMADARAIRNSVQNTLDDGALIRNDSIDLATAEEKLAVAISSAEFLVPSFPQWLARRGRLTRNIVKVIIWPPMRLEALQRYFPRMHWMLRYAVYLPTLLLTPRPVALKWHWVKIKKRLAGRLPSRMRAKVQSEVKAYEVKQQKSIESQIAEFDDMNVWEMALFERGCFFRPDIVHAHDLPQLRAGYFIGQMLGVPVVYDAHELYPVIHTLTPEQQERLRITENYYIRRVDKNITVNPFIAERMSEDYGIELPEVILNAAVPPEDFERMPRPDVIRQALGLGLHEKIVLFQGWITLDRSIGDLVAAMVDVPEHIHLVLLGFGTDVPKIRQIASDLGISRRVHFPPAVPQQELLYWVASTDAGVIPYQPVDDNHLFCSPNKLYEFIAAGVPIIANDLPYLRSVVAEHGFGVVMTLTKPQDYARAINEMFDESLGGESRFRQAIAERSSPFLWPAQELVLLKIYRDLTEKIERQPNQSIRKDAASPTAVKPPGLNLPRQKLRVFHGLYNIAGIPSIMARAERKLGIDSKAVCFPSGSYSFSPDILEQYTTDKSELLARFRRYADEFDVFVFHFGYSFANETLADIPLLKMMGKKVVFYFHGCDIRQSKETILKYEFSACKVCWPHRCNPNRDWALEMAMQYADAIWVSTPDLLEFVPGAELFLQPIDIDRHPFLRRETKPDESNQDGYKIIHAPSDKQLKGTDYVVSAVDSLRKKGVPVELMLLQGIPHEELKKRMAEADFAVDQLLFGSYGMFTVDLMAAGVPVICFIRDDLLGLYPEKPPILSANPRTIEQAITQMIGMKDQWHDISLASRSYVERRHSASVIAKRSVDIYAKLCELGQVGSEQTLESHLAE